MPFTNTQSYSSTDANNNYRGLYRDNTTRSTSGTGEDDLGALSISGGTIGATGSIEVLVCGTVTGAAGNKTIKLYFGGTAIITTATAAGTSDWMLRARISNTATGAQRIFVEWSDHQSATNFNKDYTTLAIDTTASVIVKAAAECANGADVVSQTMMEIQIQQIT